MMESKSLDNEMKKKVLWISPSVPYDNVPHGGGKTQNFYLKKLKESGEYDIHLITLARQDEVEKIDLDDYGIDYSYRLYDGGFIRNFTRKVANTGSALLPRHRLGHLIMSYEYRLLKEMIREYAKTSADETDNADNPEILNEKTEKIKKVDIVILEWTGMLLLIPEIRKYFPDAKIVIMEEDVFFQRLGRQYRSQKNLFKKRYLYDIYRTGKEAELSGLKECDMVVVYSHKDRELLEKAGVSADKLFVTAPYYDDYSIESGVPETASSKKSAPYIVFFGAMFRPENIDCAKRIIEGIMPLIENTDIELEIIGKTNDDSLNKYENEKIHIRGFVEDAGPYLRNSLAFVAPLGMGAGIKIKTLEALAAGTTVLTNDIGIEGIPARNGEEYYHCNTAKEYATKIIGLYYGSVRPLGKTAAEFMEKTYNLEKNGEGFINKLLSMKVK